MTTEKIEPPEANEGAESDLELAALYAAAGPTTVSAALRAAGMLLSELGFEAQVESLLRAVLEHTAAQRCVLLLVRDSELRAEAEATRGVVGVEVRRLRVAFTSAAISATVVRFVLGSGQFLLLDDTTEPHPFSTDSSVAPSGCRSILCVPLLKQKHLVGVLYLEHSSIPNVFSSAQVTLLRTLGPHAAVALENARLSSALERASDRQARIIDTIPALIWCATPDGVGQFFNRRWLDYTGLTLEEARSGWVVAIHPEDLPNLMAVWQGLMSSGQPGGVEARLRDARGEYRWFLFRAHPFRDERGNLVEW